MSPAMAHLRYQHAHSRRISFGILTWRIASTDSPQGACIQCSDASPEAEVQVSPAIHPQREFLPCMAGENAVQTQSRRCQASPQAPDEHSDKAGGGGGSGRPPGGCHLLGASPRFYPQCMCAHAQQMALLVHCQRFRTCLRQVTFMNGHTRVKFC